MLNPESLNPKSQILNPKSQILNRKSQILNPKSYILYPPFHFTFNIDINKVAIPRNEKNPATSVHVVTNTDDAAAGSI